MFIVALLFFSDKSSSKLHEHNGCRQQSNSGCPPSKSTNLTHAERSGGKRTDVWSHGAESSHVSVDGFRDEEVRNYERSSPSRIDNCSRHFYYQYT